MPTASPAPAASGAASPTTVSPGVSATNSVTGAPPARPGEWALGGSAGISSTLILISLPSEVTTAVAPRTVAGTAAVMASWAARGPGAVPWEAGSSAAVSWVAVLATSPADESSTRHGSSATSSGTAAVLAAPPLSSSTVRRGSANRLATSASSLETSSRSRSGDSRIAVSSAISACSVSRSRSSSSRS